MNVPAARTVFTTAYENFKGVDFTSQRPERNRFPEACNIEITDHVKKRPGYGRISIKCGGEEITDEIKVIKFMKFNNEPYYFVQAGNVLYMGKSFEELNEVKVYGEASPISSEETMSFIECDNKIYVLTGKDIFEIAYREDVLEGSNGSYTMYYKRYDENRILYYSTTGGDGDSLLTHYKIITDKEFPVYSSRFVSGGKIPEEYLKTDANKRTLLCRIDIRKSYDFPDTGLDGEFGFSYAPLYAEHIGTFSKSDLDSLSSPEAIYAQVFGEKIINEEINLLSEFRSCEYITVNSSNTEVSTHNMYILPPDYIAGTSVFVTGDFRNNWIKNCPTLHYKYGVYYLTYSAIYSAGIPPVDYGTRMRVYYKSENSRSAYESHKLKTSTAHSNMIYGNGNYYFLAGKEKKNVDYHSEVNDMTYFKGSSYQMYGNSDEILGYGQLGESLCVIKKNGSDNSLCLRSSAEVSGLGTVFPVSYCLGGAALGVSADSIKNLNGEVLYLSQTGIKALTGLSLFNSKVASDRSYYINGKLLKEENLNDAKCVIHKDKYYLGINGNVYILDASKPKDYINATANEYSYEALFWDNVPASCFYSDGENLYFGGKNGGLFKFSDELYTDDGEATKCFVATVFDDDGDFMSLKKLKKKGTGVLAKPYSRSTMEILYRYDDNNEKALKPFYPQYFDFNDIDFSRFTFYTSDRPQVIPFMKKSKKYKSFQFVLKSDVDEPFAFLGIIKRYEIVNYVKRM